MNKKLVLVLNFKMPTIVGILKLRTSTNDTTCCSEQDNFFIYLYLALIEDYKIHNQVI